MEELLIFKFELKEIHDALRLASVRLKCNKKEKTALDRQILKALKFTERRLNTN